jgi:hypothetical protein
VLPVCGTAKNERIQHCWTGADFIL